MYLQSTDGQSEGAANCSVIWQVKNKIQIN
jgi:hypothetical protein